MTRAIVPRPSRARKYRDRGENKQIKVRTALTPALQELATKAWHLGYPSLVRMQKRYPFHADTIEALFGERLTTLIPSFDACKSSLKTWVKNQMRGVLLDSLRRKFNDVSPTSYRKERVGGWNNDWSLHMSYVTEAGECGDDDYDVTRSLIYRLAAPDPEGAERDAAETEDYLLQPLSRRDREVISRYAAGETMREIGEALGISESRVSQIHSACQPLLRSRLESLCA